MFNPTMMNDAEIHRKVCRPYLPLVWDLIFTPAIEYTIFNNAPTAKK